MVSAQASSFMSNLTWINCSFCFMDYTQNRPFFLLECRTIACGNCFSKMRSRSEPNKVNCVHCNRTSNTVRIFDQMPPHIRQRLTNSWQQSSLQAMEAAERYQSNILGNTYRQIERRVSRLVEQTNTLRARNQHHGRENAAMGRETNAEIAQLVKLYQAEFIEKFIKMTEQEQDRFDVLAYLRDQQAGSSSRSGHTRSTTSSRRNHRDFGITPDIDNPFGTYQLPADQAAYQHRSTQGYYGTHGRNRHPSRHIRDHHGHHQRF